MGRIHGSRLRRGCGPESRQRQECAAGVVHPWVGQDLATELSPLIATPGSQAYGAANGVTTKELAEAKLLAMQKARAAQQWRDSPEEVSQGLPIIMISA